jgi:hypothetical protein
LAGKGRHFAPCVAPKQLQAVTDDPFLWPGSHCLLACMVIESGLTYALTALQGGVFATLQNKDP